MVSYTYNVYVFVHAAALQTVGGRGRRKYVVAILCSVAEEVCEHGDGLHFSIATLQSVHSLIYWVVNSC